MLDARSDSFRRRLLHITKSFVGCRRRGACKRGQPLRFWMAPSQRGPARPGPSCRRGPAWARVPLPLIVCAFIWICTVCEVYMCEVRVMQTLQQFYCFDKKASLHRNEKKQNKIQAALRSSVKLEKAKYKEPRSVRLQTAIPYRGFFKKKNKTRG